MKPDAAVFVVDDDLSIHRPLHGVIESVGLAVTCYAAAEEFLDGYDPTRPGCLVLAVRLPGLSGLDLQDRLAAKKVGSPPKELLR